MQTIRFLKDSRHGDWRKGDRGQIVEKIASRGENLNDVYIIEIAGYWRVWVTESDFAFDNQLALWEERVLLT